MIMNRFVVPNETCSGSGWIRGEGRVDHFCSLAQERKSFGRLTFYCVWVGTYGQQRMNIETVPPSVTKRDQEVTMKVG